MASQEPSWGTGEQSSSSLGSSQVGGAIKTASDGSAEVKDLFNGPFFWGRRGDLAGLAFCWGERGLNPKPRDKVRGSREDKGGGLHLTRRGGFTFTLKIKMRFSDGENTFTNSSTPR